MDKVNFTGIRNIGAYMKPLPYAMPNTTKTYLIAQLTDDFDGKDLSEFKEAAKKCEQITGKCVFPYDNRFIHIMTNVVNNGKDIPALAVNHIIIPARRETLAVFSFIAKLTRKIAKMPDEKFKICKDFKFGPDGDSFIFPAGRVSNFNPENPEKTREFLEEIYSPESDRQVARMINRHIQMEMEDYLK